AGEGVKKGSDKEVPLYTKLHTHMGRKTFISFAFSEKISTVDITKVTGHTSEQILKHYVNSMRDEVKEEFQMVNSFAVNKDDILLTRAQKKELKNKELEAKRLELEAEMFRSEKIRARKESKKM
ncbi:MAG: hypothetical protein RL755_1547, partial [Pseudomonadota bacterium]